MNERLETLLREASKTNKFYMSLLTQFDKGYKLSSKQMFYVHKLDNAPNTPSDFEGKTAKFSRGLVAILRDKGHDDIFVFNKIDKVHKETNKAILVDISPIRSITGRCGRCGKTLTDEISKATKFGPTCSEIIGMKRENRGNAESINKFLETFFSNKKPIEQVWIPKKLVTIEKGE